MKTKPSEKLLEVAQEITFAKALACNDETLRNRALRNLKKWLISKSKTSSKNFTEDGFIRLWRGLFYNVWMSDKPLVQEEVVENISHLVHCFSEFSDALTFIMCFFKTLSETWFGLDVHRLDKYLMLVRRFLRQSIMLVEKHDWEQEYVLELTAVFKNVFQKSPLGLLMHICEIYLEELAKVSKGRLDKNTILEFIKPFGEIMSTSSDPRLIKHISDYIYLYLLQQSDLGIKHQLKFNAWKRMGCPGGNINVLKEVEMSSDEECFDEPKYTNTNFDARAGNVDVLLPPLIFDGSTVLSHLSELKKRSSTTTKSRKCLNAIINKYETYNRGKYPLGIHKVDTVKDDFEYEEIENAAFELMEEERMMYDNDKPPNKKKFVKRDKSSRGKWIVTSESQQNKLNVGDTLSRNLGQSNWQVSSSPITSVKNDNRSSLIGQQFSNEDERNCTKKRKKLEITEEYSQKEQMSADRKVNNGSPKTNGDSTIGNFGGDHKDPTSTTASSRKKVKFILKRNTSQDEKDYRRSLKNKPKLKFNGKPAVGVLKSSPFSSPVNPFIISPPGFK